MGDKGRGKEGGLAGLNGVELSEVGWGGGRPGFRRVVPRVTYDSPYCGADGFRGGAPTRFNMEPRFLPCRASLDVLLTAPSFIYLGSLVKYCDAPSSPHVCWLAGNGAGRGCGGKVSSPVFILFPFLCSCLVFFFFSFFYSCVILIPHRTKAQEQVALKAM